jgi:large subunit ribosomal protein L25
MAIELNLTKRTVTGKKVNNLRKTGVLPATVYGKHLAPITIQTDARAFAPVMKAAGKTSLITLNIAGEEPIAAFIHSFQRHPVSRAIIHVDFHAVDMSETVEVDVPVHMKGVSPLVVRGDAIFNNVTTLRVRALPGNLPTEIVVDVSGLDMFDKAIHVSDIKLVGGAIILGHAGDLVVGLATAGRGEGVAVANAAEPELVRTREAKA